MLFEFQAVATHHPLPRGGCHISVMAGAPSQNARSAASRMFRWHDDHQLLSSSAAHRVLPDEESAERRGHQPGRAPERPGQAGLLSHALVGVRRTLATGVLGQRRG